MENSEYGKYGVGVAVSIVLLSMVCMGKKKKKKAEKLGVAVQVGAEAGFAVRNAQYKGLVIAPYVGITTVASLFQKSCEWYSGQLLFLTRKLINKDVITAKDGSKLEQLYLADNRSRKTYAQVYNGVCIFAAGLVEFGHDIDTRVAIFAEPQEKCQIALQGCFRQAITVVILDASLSEENLVHCLNETQVSTLICDSKQLNKLTAISSSLKTIRKVIYFEDDLGYRATTNMCDSSESNKDWKLSSFDEVERLGREAQVSARCPIRVMITHGNLVAAAAAINTVIPRLQINDVYMAYLPLTRISELIIQLAMVSSCCPIAYGSPSTLMDTSSKIMIGTKGDVSVFKPTIMAAVPAIIDHVRQGVLQKVEEEGSKKHFDIACKHRLAAIQGSWFGSWGLEKWFWDFERARAILGGKIRFMLCAEAPLSEDCRRFINICLGAPIGQVYGSTETCGAVAFNVQWGDSNVSRVRLPLPCCYIKLVSWEEGGYTISEKPMPRGEVVVGGLGVTMGYFNDDMETRKVYKVDEGGMHWFYTGDIGQFHADGCLEIIGRKEDIVKLQDGDKAMSKSYPKKKKFSVKSNLNLKFD
ncbi:AMP-dependent synthetase/ligase [Corchorus olitorius]|uniref:AMP-dependent synthetase/ligase n=1 Tax=Corchorus olitorius TaxID=93759 RepID=A0A1R3J4A6_9ROSI|nr:AMP-dependent synthetase/ligase [Corchorus olitorius]